MQQKQGFGGSPLLQTVRGFPSRFFNFFGHKKRAIKNMNENDEYWQRRCEFWCANYLELAQSVKRLVICAERVDDYQELAREVTIIKQILEKDAYGSGK
jgi:hypothetical protein